PGASDKDYPGIRWHPRSPRKCVLRNLSSRRGGIEVRHAPQLRHRRGGAGGHRRPGGRHCTAAAALRAARPAGGSALPPPRAAGVDALPTLTAISLLADGTTEVSTPARGRRPLRGDTTDTRPAAQLLATGRLDALDSVARTPLSIIGAAFNNRLLFGGFAGEPDDTLGALNPFHHPAQENVALLLLDAHRLLDDDPIRGPVRFQSAVLERI